MSQIFDNLIELAVKIKNDPNRDAQERVEDYEMFIKDGVSSIRRFFDATFEHVKDARVLSKETDEKNAFNYYESEKAKTFALDSLMSHINIANRLAATFGMEPIFNHSSIENGEFDYKNPDHRILAQLLAFEVCEEIMLEEKAKLIQLENTKDLNDLDKLEESAFALGNMLPKDDPLLDQEVIEKILDDRVDDAR